MTTTKKAETRNGADAKNFGGSPDYGYVERTRIENAKITGPWVWDVRLNQLSSGRFHSKLQFIKTAGIMLYEQKWQQRVEVTGASPSDCVMLGTNIVSHRAPFEWCGKQINHQRFSSVAAGTEIDFKSPANGHHVVLLVRHDLLVEALGPKGANALGNGRFIDFNPVDGQRLINTMTGVIRMAGQNPDILKTPLMFRSMQSDLFSTLGECIANSGHITPLPPPSLRRKSVRQAIAFADQKRGLVTALEMALACRVSQRTLEYAFREQLEMTPGAYLRLYRLNAAHKDLVAADPKTVNVGDVAQRYGFNHPGRFSLIHRQLFHELPSAVLKRA